MRRPIVLLCGPAGVGKSTIADQLAASYGFKIISQADPIKEIARDLWGFTDEELWGPSECRNKVVPAEELRARAQTDFQKEVVDDSIRVPGSQVYALAVLAIASGILGYNVIHECLPDKLGASINDFIVALRNFRDKNGGLSARLVLQLLGTEVGRAYDARIWTNKAINKARGLVDRGAPGVVIPDGRFLSEVLAANEAGVKAVLVRGQGIETRGAAAHPSETEIFTVPLHFFDAIIENDKKLGKEAWVSSGFLGIHALVTNLFPTVAIRGARHFDDSVAEGVPHYYAETFYHGTKDGRG